MLLKNQIFLLFQRFRMRKNNESFVFQGTHTHTFVDYFILAFAVSWRDA